MRPWRLLWKRNGPGARLPPTRILRLRLMLAATAHERSQANLVQENHSGSVCNQSSISSHCTLCGTPYTWTCGDSSSRHRMPILGVSSLDFRPLSSGLLFARAARQAELYQVARQCRSALCKCREVGSRSSAPRPSTRSAHVILRFPPIRASGRIFSRPFADASRRARRLRAREVPP